MEEQFILRVPPSIAERIDRLLSENASSSEDKSLDLVFSEDGRTGTFVIGNDRFPASLLDLPSVVESYKTYDDSALVKTADVGQMIMVREPGDASPDVVEYRHGLTPPMRDARKRRFRREPDLNPELVQRVEKDLVNIMSGGTVESLDMLKAMGKEKLLMKMHAMQIRKLQLHLLQSLRFQVQEAMLGRPTEVTLMTLTIRCEFKFHAWLL
ncbi:TBP-associated factor 7 isoform 5 [Theobroma cacao]|uniref:TBP-associated factor 7 isoform 5 n=1 Tax=Theobroma cacao TaxID=3641 RepID=A0A061GT20_THECC|nr:TBP-associated factor 7 isoform 5 [Theobroma cacao]